MDKAKTKKTKTKFIFQFPNRVDGQTLVVEKEACAFYKGIPIYHSYQGILFSFAVGAFVMHAGSMADACQAIEFYFNSRTN